MGFHLPRSPILCMLAMLLTCTPAATHAQDYASGLVGHWTLDETTGNIITDSSASGNNGTWVDNDDNDVAGETTTGVVSRALGFDGVDDIITLGDNYDLTGDYTICSWAFPGNTNIGYIFGKYNEATGQGIFLRIDNNSTDWISSTNNDATTILRGENAVEYNAWQHICVTVSPTPGTSTLYKNGTVLDSNTTMPAHIDNAINASIGNRYDNNRQMDGALDDVRIYNRTLSAADIAALYVYTVVDYSCSNPDGVEGEIVFNQDVRALQYCNGTKWVAIGAQQSLNQGINLHLPFDDGTGTNAADAAGTNDGTLQNMSPASDWVDGIIQGGLNFSGDNRVQVSGSVINPNRGTFSMWYKPDIDYTAATNELFLTGFWNETFSNNDFFLDLYESDDSFYCGIRDNGGTTHANGVNSAALASLWQVGKWMHIACTYDDSLPADNIKIYINGVESNTPAEELNLSDWSATPWVPPANLTIGNDGEGFANSAQGTLDDFRVYDRPLSASEISQLYAQGSSCTLPSEGDLVAHWTMNDTSGSTIIDSSGNGNNGTWVDGVNNDVTEETVAGQDGTAIQFDGTNDFIRVSHSASIDFVNTVTMAFWLKSGLGGNPYKRIISKNPFNSNPGIEIQQTNTANAIHLRIDTASKTDNLAGTISGVLDNNWHHIVYVVDQGTIRAYLNGTLTNTATYITDAGGFQNTSDLIIGVNTNLAVGYYDGILDDIRLYNKALSDTEVAALYGSIGGGSCNISTCSSPFGVQGEMVFNADYDVMQYCNGGQWIAMGPPGNGGGTCSNPTGSAGEMRYNADYNVLQYCEGDEWISVISERP